MTGRSWAIFLEIHRELPREGPGDDASTRRAWALMQDLPPHPTVLDIGCGPGAQTLVLADLTPGPIVAVDLHPPYLIELDRRARQAGCADRIRTVRADMQALDLPEAPFDVIWAEGSVYITGFDRGLAAWRPLLRRGGYVAVSELTWLRPDPPPELAAFFAEAYPAMRDVAGNLDGMQRAGYAVAGHFTLPESAWWDAYYAPLERRLETLRTTYAHDDEALAVLDAEQREIDCFRANAAYYGYVFYVGARKRDVS